MLADSGNRRPAVVVADDDSDILALLVFRLERCGYDVFGAADGTHALELLERAAPDLVVLDWKMPGRHGAFVLDELKERRPDVPVIVLTAETKEPHRALAEALHADAFIAKPFSVKELLETAERLLGERRPGSNGHAA